MWFSSYYSHFEVKKRNNTFSCQRQYACYGSLIYMPNSTPCNFQALDRLGFVDEVVNDPEYALIPLLCLRMHARAIQIALCSRECVCARA